MAKKAAEAAAPAAPKASRRNDAAPAATRSPTVTIGCKLPNGLHLELTDKSGNKVRVTVKGMNASRVIGGYGLTHGVDREFAERWFDLYENYQPVKTGAIFIEGNREDAQAHARDGRDVRTGLEPLDRNNPAPGIKKVPRGNELDANDAEDDEDD